MLLSAPMPSKTRKVVSKKKVVRRVPKVKSPSCCVSQDALTKYLPFMVGLAFFVLFLAVVAYAVALKSQWLASQDNVGFSAPSAPVVNTAKPLPALPKK
ncbi:hypothetical protein COT49_00650 [candidate division WWE3 bacterium CG08_land_8_20_14_0_20_40_13]|uniref:Uncharacterized protein n=1 Tax=candidate division WWE3 bacterium CG08_land_8_20_14_0_20_40_13 TaxID=1975084 RepID=A0A2H0XEM9_UNCKA|nr:MAG: hypothetical protein COT49_00650 [candidate division WWE3 bacterium CG08_land_8_20_14_0_20_40_13]